MDRQTDRRADGQTGTGRAIKAGFYSLTVRLVGGGLLSTTARQKKRDEVLGVA